MREMAVFRASSAPPSPESASAASVGVAGEHLGVLGPGEPVARFLVLAALGVHRLYLLQREACLLQLGVGGARRCPQLF